MKKIAVLVALILTMVGMTMPTALAVSSVTASTPLVGSTKARLNNVQLAAEAIDGTRVGYGDHFSFNGIVGPRTSRYGYESAINGRGVKVTGGGVAQVAATLYMALKQLDGIEYTQKQTYGNSYNGKYVSSSRDAILVEYDDIDFSFVNEYGGFDISMWIEQNELVCELELRGNGRAISSASFEIDGNRAVRTNVTLAANSIYETSLYNGDVFSFNEIVGARTTKNGYLTGRNGRGVNVTGGGVAQVASVVWMAVKNLDCVKVTSKSTYGSNYNQHYVQSSKDAIMTDYNGKVDFKFRYTGDGMLSIYTYVQDDDLVCDVYESFD